MTDVDPRERIRAALEGLPVLDDRRHMIDESLEPLAGAAFFLVADLPRAISVGPVKARDELLKFARLAKAMHEAIADMHRDAHAAIEAETGNDSVLSMQQKIRRFGNAAFRAASKINTSASEPESEGGRPQKRGAAEIAKEAAIYYCRLTGKTPTVITPQKGKAYSPFMDLLAVLFDVHGVKASPESQAKNLDMEKIKAEAGSFLLLK